MYNPQTKGENVVNWPNYYLDSVKNRIMLTSVNQNDLDNTMSIGIDSSVQGKNDKQPVKKGGSRSRKASSRRYESDAVTSSAKVNKSKKDIADIIKQHDIL